MAVKFPLKMADGAAVRTLEDLREHFDLTTVLTYYDNRRLVKWLENGYYDEEAEKVAALDAASPDFAKELCDILGVDHSEETHETVDLGSISNRNERLNRLKQYTADDAILAAVDSVAFTQEELVSLLEKGTTEVYLLGDGFQIPVKGFEGTIYIAITEMGPVDLGNTVKMNERVGQLRQFTDDAAVLAAVDSVAFTQKELRALLKKGAKKVYLCGEKFHIPNGFENVTYIGVNKPIAEFIIDDISEGYNRIGPHFKGYEDGDFKYLRRLAEEGDMVAQYWQGVVCEKFYVGCNPKCGASCYKEYVKWFRKSAEQGYAAAQVKMGELYLQGKDSRVVEKSIEDALAWFELVTKENCTDVQLQMRLGKGYNELGDVDWETPCDDEDEDKDTVRESTDIPSDILNAVKVLADIEGISISDSELVEFVEEEDERNIFIKRKAVNWYAAAVEQGNSAAAMILGEMYRDVYNFPCLNVSIDESVKWYKRAVELGESKAAIWLGEFYWPKDIDEASRWYKRAEELGDYGALTVIGDRYWGGDSVEEDRGEAIKWYKKAAEFGSNKAKIILGFLCLSGLESEKEAVKWFQNADASDVLDIYHKYGYDISSPDEDPLQTIRQSANQGNQKAQVALADFYAEIIRARTKEAKQTLDFFKRKVLSWYTRAAEDGDMQVQLKLADFCSWITTCFEAEVCNEDFLNAEKWYNKVAEQGCPDTYMRIGNLYLESYYWDKDYLDDEWDEKTAAKAAIKTFLKYYKKAASKGCVAALVGLGDFYRGTDLDWEYDNEYGWSDDILCYQDADEEEAIAWYKKAATKGSLDAYLRLGELYEYHSAEEDALKWYRKAAEQGHIEAHIKVSEMYHRGAGGGVNKGEDVAEARKWCLKAAEQGYPPAQERLGDLYYYDAEGDVNIDEAKKWYLLAAAKGRQGAKDMLQYIEEEEDDN